MGQKALARHFMWPKIVGPRIIGPKNHSAFLSLLCQVHGAAEQTYKRGKVAIIVSFALREFLRARQRPLGQAIEVAKDALAVLEVKKAAKYVPEFLIAELTKLKTMTPPAEHAQPFGPAEGAAPAEGLAAAGGA